jgi:hypothetical protein
MQGKADATAIERLIQDRPKIHEWPDGKPDCWAAAPEVLRFIFDRVTPGAKTLETGSGLTTIVFALAAADHIAVTPFGGESGRIAEYCRSLGIKPCIRFLAESSDVALPRADSLPEKLDFVFIDGAHRFPFPIIDFHYTAHRLRIGGILGIDDVYMPSVKVLVDFVRGEAEWELIDQVTDTAFFRRTAETKSEATPSDLWASQHINRRFYQRWLRRRNSRLRRLIGMSRRFMARPGHYLRRLQGGTRSRDTGVS